MLSQRWAILGADVHERRPSAPLPTGSRVVASSYSLLHATIIAPREPLASPWLVYDQTGSTIDDAPSIARTRYRQNSTWLVECTYTLRTAMGR